MSDKLKDLRSCAKGRRKDMSKDLTANLPKVDKQSLIDRIMVKPHVGDFRSSDPSFLSYLSYSTPTPKKSTALPHLKTENNISSDRPSKQNLILPKLRESSKQTSNVTGISSITHQKLEDLYGMTDLQKVIEVARTMPQVDFLYLTPAVKKISVNYHYYNLKTVPYQNIDKSDYCTVSKRGFMRAKVEEDNEFVYLDRFQQEYMYFQQLVKIRMFRMFRQWKAFSTWKKNIKFEKIEQAHAYLQQHLFLSNATLCKTLLKARVICLQMDEMVFCKLKEGKLYTMQDFLQAQSKQVSEVRNRLLELREKLKKEVMGACKAVFKEANFDIFQPIDRNSIYSKVQKNSRTKLFNDASSDMQEISYTEQVNKQNLCRRLTCFIRLLDYLVVDTLHMMVLCSVRSLLYQVVRRTHRTPNEASVVEWLSLVKEASNAPLNTEKLHKKLEDRNKPKMNQKIALATVHGENEVDPIFVIELKLFDDRLSLRPSKSQISSVIKFLIFDFQDAVLQVECLVTDPFFDVFTRPVFSSRMQRPLRQDGPSLKSIFVKNNYTKILFSAFMKNIDVAFKAAYLYMATYQTLVQMHLENLHFNEEEVKAKGSVSLFSELLSKYHRQFRMFDVMQTRKCLGLLFIDSNEFKNNLLPSPIKCLEIIHTILPWTARKEVDKLTSELQDAEYNLDSQCTTTKDYVNQLVFLEQIQERMDDLVKEAGVVQALYGLIEDYAVPTPPEDFAVYATLMPSINAVYNQIDESLADREKNIVLFNVSIEKDIAEFNRELKTLKQQAQNPVILDPNIKVEAVFSILNKLDEKLTELKQRAETFIDFQKALKVPVTSFEELDDVSQELTQKQLLWSSITNWDKLKTEWMEVLLETLNPEELNLTTAKFSEIVTNLEKGLPPNGVVPKLREKVDTMKLKLPLVTSLRNPSLKQRHKELIEQTLDFTFTPESPMTLGRLESLKAFQHIEAIQQISSKASQESNLEAILKKVEESWKSLEFTVIPYKDQKDVFILGSIDDIQFILDESFNSISAIMSSKLVTPIKVKVDAWYKQLRHFGATLEAWMQCQHSWLYFESIFSAPDIQRQLPAEAKLFATVDKSFRDIMRKVSKVPLAIRAGVQPGLLESFQNNNMLIEQVQKCMDAYLESKRVFFPRFYFLSNDEMLEILSQGRNPQAVQPYLRSCFDAILKIEFASVGSGPTDAVTTTNEILSMVSPEGERVLFGKGLKARGNVEEWLGKVEDVMKLTIRKLLSNGITNYLLPSKESWITSNISQVVCTVAQCMWCKDMTELFERKGDKMGLLREMEIRSVLELNNLVTIARSKLAHLDWLTTCTLIITEVHMRDVVLELVRSRVSKADAFEWRRQLKYVWDKEEEKMIIKMATVVLNYGNEYIGNTNRLVITPLTDRVHLCLLGATQLNLGGCTSGPAGTGKTETIKDLAKGVAIKCMVFNCSGSLDHRLMGRFFSGLAQSGTWSCFDEFNRINIEVLSVVAQQLIDIKNAKNANASYFMFEGREIKLLKDCNVFTTINPGYLGRTELPDNLKSLLRPISMMLPDYVLVSEVILYSLGFETAKMLSQKVTHMYKLSSEQLSKQDHYDFGMRALKSILVASGSYKRQSSEKDENQLVIRALRDFNIPRLVAKDVVLFEAILRDMFPGVERQQISYMAMEEEIGKVAKKMNLKVVPLQISKVIQLYEICKVRQGIILVGFPGSGKTIVLDLLAELCRVQASKTELENVDPFFRPVKRYTINPKAINLKEMFGFFDPLTLDWVDGLVGNVVRQAVNDTSEDHQWVLYDGPIDVKWVENMNTALDDNGLLCLANSERIKLNSNIAMFFEVDCVAMASPTIISRCGTVYFADELGWKPYMWSWMEKQLKTLVDDELYKRIETMFVQHVDKGLEFVESCNQPINQTSLSRVQTMCKLLESLLVKSDEVDWKMEQQKLLVVVDTTFVWCYLWGLAGNIQDDDWDKFDAFVREEFEEFTNTKMPTSGTLWGQKIDFPSRRLELWEKSVSLFKYSKNVSFSEMVVPSADTVKFGYLMEKLMVVDRPVLFVGATGVGKSTLSRYSLNMLNTTKNFKTSFVTLSAQSSSARLQELIRDRMDRKRKNVLGAPPNSKGVIIMIDDMNMPKLDLYNSQPPLELLRQVIDKKGFYHRQGFYWIHLNQLNICAACGLPGGGRNAVSPRLLRHFSIFNLPLPNNHCLRLMFNSILGGFFIDFTPRVRHCVDLVVRAAIEIYGRMRVEFLPTPNKSHYIFNLRDLSKCMQGVTQSDQSYMQTPTQLYRLFYHETLRVFHDRLVTSEDKKLFYQLLADITSHLFVESAMTAEELETPMLFGDFIVVGLPKEQRVYREITHEKTLKTVLIQYLDSHKAMGGKLSSLIFFMDAVEHLVRIARILKPERANALLVGVGGCGKRSLTILASHINMCKCFQVRLKRGYDISSFHDDLKTIYHIAGIKNEPIVLLLSDSQILIDEFMEDLNNILSSGYVPNLFNAEDIEKNINLVRSDAKNAGVEENNREDVFRFFINRVVSNLHIVLCMSPMGQTFRTWCRMFPALVSCCTIDWYVPWPYEALLSVSEQALGKAAVVEDKAMLKALSTMCVEVHESVGEMATKFYDELKRRYYVGPSNYLDLISLYVTMHDEKKKQLIVGRDRLGNGLLKIMETNQLVVKMKNDLIQLEPEMKDMSESTERLLEQLAREQADADEVRKVVMMEEMTATQKAKETAAIAEDAQRDLNEALPALDNAIKSLDALDKSDISEIRVYTVPPELVQTVMEAVCLLLGVKSDWQSARLLLGDANFLKNLYEYDKDRIPDSLIKKLKKYIDNPKFTPEAVEKVSRASRSLCMWVKAIDLYAHVFRTVEPKRKKLEEAQIELNTVLENLEEKKTKLATVEEQIRILQEGYDKSVDEKLNLTRNIALTQTRLKRAGKLITALITEKSRWEVSKKDFEDKVYNVIGDVFIAASCIIYFGAFSSHYRDQLMSHWIAKCLELNVPVTTSMTLRSVMVDPYEVRLWNSYGLPNDKVSIENAVLGTRAQRWPLMIDPQEQANIWIRNMETASGLKVIHPHKKNYLQSLINAIRLGVPVLLEDVEETLDTALDPVLFKKTYMSNGRLVLSMGDEEVDYDKNFRFYMTTKLSNPHFMFETCIKVTIINFTVTQEALEDQLLGDVMRLERMDLEEQFNQLIVEINTYKNQLRSIEDKTLKLLFELEGQVLDNEELINTLNDSKVMAGAVYERLEEAEVTEGKILVSREKYRVVATRGSVLYSVVANLSNINIMYQFSLKYFKALFSQTVITSPHSPELETRLTNILLHTHKNVYANVSRGLFERDKLVFSFLLCTETMKQCGYITNEEWDFFLKDSHELPVYSDHAVYEQLKELSSKIPDFANFIRTLKNDTYMRINIGALNVVIQEDDIKVPYEKDVSEKTEADFNEKIKKDENEESKTVGESHGFSQLVEKFDSKSKENIRDEVASSRGRGGEREGEKQMESRTALEIDGEGVEDEKREIVKKREKEKGSTSKEVLRKKSIKSRQAEGNEQLEPSKDNERRRKLSKVSFKSISNSMTDNDKNKNNVSNNSSAGRGLSEARSRHAGSREANLKSTKTNQKLSKMLNEFVEQETKSKLAVLKQGSQGTVASKADPMKSANHKHSQQKHSKNASDKRKKTKSQQKLDFQAQTIEAMASQMASSLSHRSFSSTITSRQSTLSKTTSHSKISVKKAQRKASSLKKSSQQSVAKTSIQTLNSTASFQTVRSATGQPNLPSPVASSHTASILNKKSTRKKNARNSNEGFSRWKSIKMSKYTRRKTYWRNRDSEYRPYPSIGTEYHNEIMESTNSATFRVSNWKSNWKSELKDYTSFQKLMLLKIFKYHMLVNAVIEFVKSNLGVFFLKASENTFDALFKNSNNHTPLLFILSSGSDPMRTFLKFTVEKEFSDRYHAISMGQGQGVVAKASINQAMKTGDWVFLQNCHLASSWMPQLEELVKGISDKPSEVNSSFRLFLSAFPTSSFPVSVLQNSLKLTNEPPRGLKASVREGLNSIDHLLFEHHPLGSTWKKILFSLCFFHSVIIERKKYGFLGWICKYDFNEYDRECAIVVLSIFCTTGNISWDAIFYSISEFLYGGRVTDQWDQRCLRALMKRFLHQDMLIDNYAYSESGIYYPPNLNTLEDYKDYVDNLPNHDLPEIFCMHTNADMLQKRQESQKLLWTIQNLQSSHTIFSDEETFTEVVHSTVIKFLEVLPDQLSLDEAKKELYRLDDQGRMNSLTTVLLQEFDAYNALLKSIKYTLKELQKAISGLVLMDEDLESLCQDIYNNKLPRMWLSKAYNSIKPLASWVADLVLRCENIQNWVQGGEPCSFWISGLFYPQSFLTGVLQRHARRYTLGIDHLSFRYHVLSGCYFNQPEEKSMSKERYLEIETRVLENQRHSVIVDEFNENQSNTIDASKKVSVSAESSFTNILLTEDVFKDGVMVHGIFADGFTWDDEKDYMNELTKRDLTSPMPIILFEPFLNYEPYPRLYACPLFRTPKRHGELSTTGHSTNFVLTIYLKTNEPKEHWVGRGSALVCQLNL